MSNTIVLYGLLIIATVGLLCCLCLYFSNVACVVKAGDVKVYQKKYLVGVKAKPKFIMVGKDVVDTTRYKYRIVKGESMHYYGIHDNDCVLIEPLTGDKKSVIQDKPIVMFAIRGKHWKIRESNEKLRKFIAYIQIDSNQIDFGALYELHKEDITLGKDEFVEDCKKSFNKLQYKQKQGILTLSETYQCEKGRNHYSIHALDELKGRVEFVCHRAASA